MSIVEKAAIANRVMHDQLRAVGAEATPTERAHLAGFLLGISLSQSADDPVDRANLRRLLTLRVVDWFRFRSDVTRLLP